MKVAEGDTSGESSMKKTAVEGSIALWYLWPEITNETPGQDNMQFRFI